jgi:hypothetical protein
MRAASAPNNALNACGTTAAAADDVAGATRSALNAFAASSAAEELALADQQRRLVGIGVRQNTSAGVSGACAAPMRSASYVTPAAMPAVRHGLEGGDVAAVASAGRRRRSGDRARDSHRQGVVWQPHRVPDHSPLGHYRVSAME